MGMRCDLGGLLLNLARQIESPDGMHGESFAGAAREAAQHVRETRAGEHTVAEFAEFYCIAPDKTDAKGVSP